MRPYIRFLTSFHAFFSSCYFGAPRHPPPFVPADYGGLLLDQALQRGCPMTETLPVGAAKKLRCLHVHLRSCTRFLQNVTPQSSSATRAIIVTIMAFGIIMSNAMLTTICWVPSSLKHGQPQIHLFSKVLQVKWRVTLKGLVLVAVVESYMGGFSLRLHCCICVVVVAVLACISKTINSWGVFKVLWKRAPPQFH